MNEKLEGMSTGADAYVEKPFDAEYLTAIVKNLLKQREQLKQKFSGLSSSHKSPEELVATDRLFMEKVNEIVKARLTDPSFAMDQLQNELGMSRSQLYRKFKGISDRNPSEYIRILRIQHSLELLKTKQYTVYEVAYMSGFSNETHFITCSNGILVSLLVNTWPTTPDGLIPWFKDRNLEHFERFLGKIEIHRFLHQPIFI